MEFFVFLLPRILILYSARPPNAFWIFSEEKNTNRPLKKTKKHLAALKRKVRVCCMFSLPFLDLGLGLICFPVMWVATGCGKNVYKLQEGYKGFVGLRRERNKATSSYCKQKFYVFLTYCKQWSWLILLYLRVL